MPHKFEPTKQINIHSIKSFKQFLRNGLSLKNCTLQNIDFSKVDITWQNLKIKNTAFLGCQLKIDQEIYLRRQGATIINAPTNLPYQPFRSQLYNWQELMKGYSFEKDESIDYKIYRHFSKQKYTPSINEALWQRIHDHAMDDALRILLEFDKNGMTNKKCVGVMGGHSTRRDDPFYVKSALTAKLLTENDYLIASGGGPGIMEHEPSNLFASHIAKYFSNSIREDTLLAVSLYGIICAPGSAGTVQEIFMDATQNHYGTFNYISPMVFLGKEHYSVKTMIYPLLRQLAWGKEYYDLLHITDEPSEVLAFLQAHPPFKIK